MTALGERSRCLHSADKITIPFHWTETLDFTRIGTGGSRGTSTSEFNCNPSSNFERLYSDAIISRSRLHRWEESPNPRAICLRPAEDRLRGNQ